MSKKKNKKFEKKKLISLFEQGNYQKVISKAKQFKIEGMSEEELEDIVVNSYFNLANSSFVKGDVVRAIRDIDSLLKISSDEKFRVTKLKYLCYIEHFEDAVKLGKELINIKDKKIAKEAIFLYLMANIYSGNYELDTKVLKSIPISRQKYILGFLELMQDNRELALDYFKDCNPRSKVEKDNLKLLIAIISDSNKIDIYEDSKPLYRYLITRDSNGKIKKKNSREMKKELDKEFSNRDKSSKIDGLLALKSYVPINIILKSIKDEEKRNRLIYNNIVLLVENGKEEEALKIFLKYRDSMVNFIESANLLILIKSRADDSKSDLILLSFFIKYLELHSKKISPFLIDYILISLYQSAETNKKAIELGIKYDRDAFVFLLRDIMFTTKFDQNNVIRLNRIYNKFSSFNEIIFEIMITFFELMDNELNNLLEEEIMEYITLISTIVRVFQKLESPNKRYKSINLKILKLLSLTVQSFSYRDNETIYLNLMELIENHIEYFKYDRLKLPVDIKALFISISEKRSVKRDDYYNDDEDDYFSVARRVLFKDYIDSYKYDFNESDYNIFLIKKEYLNSLRDESVENPFEILKKFDNLFIKKLYSLILDLIKDANSIRGYEPKVAIEKIVSNLDIELSDTRYRDSLVSTLSSYDKKDIELSLLLFEYSLESVLESKRESVWYLKWIVGYLDFIDKNGLDKDIKFEKYLEYFIRIQNKLEFKTLKKTLNRVVKKFGNRGGLFD